MEKFKTENSNYGLSNYLSVDKENGLYYYRSRMCNPFVGRFIQKDKVRNGINWFIYVKNNPVIYIDPRGFCACVKYWGGYYDYWCVKSYVGEPGNCNGQWGRVFGSEEKCEFSGCEDNDDDDDDKCQETEGAAAKFNCDCNDVIVCEWTVDVDCKAISFIFDPCLGPGSGWDFRYERTIEPGQENDTKILCWDLFQE